MFSTMLAHETVPERSVLTMIVLKLFSLDKSPPCRFWVLKIARMAACLHGFARIGLVLLHRNSCQRLGAGRDQPVMSRPPPLRAREPGMPTYEIEDTGDDEPEDDSTTASARRPRMTAWLAAAWTAGICGIVVWSIPYTLP
jgi:hypothetical protein